MIACDWEENESYWFRRGASGEQVVFINKRPIQTDSNLVYWACLLASKDNSLANHYFNDIESARIWADCSLKELGYSFRSTKFPPNFLVLR